MPSPAVIIIPRSPQRGVPPLTVVNPETDPPITNDAKHHDFFDAIVNKRGTIRDMTARELAAYRRYVRSGDKPEPVMQPSGATG